MEYRQPLFLRTSVWLVVMLCVRVYVLHITMVVRDSSSIMSLDENKHVIYTTSIIDR